MYHISGINGLDQPLAERAEMPYMVKMVMGNQNSRKGIHVKTILDKGLLKPAKAYTRIYKYTVTVCPEKIAVAATSARQTHESYVITFHLHNIS